MRLVNTLILTFVLAISALAQQNLQVGQAAPDFAATTIDGRSVNLKDLQGKVVVLTFWSTRCAICHSEFPKLNQVVQRYAGKDVVFLAPTMENAAKVQPYLQKNQVSPTVLTNGFGLVMKYADLSKDGAIKMGFPAYYVIDKNGQINHRAEGWDKTQHLDSRISKLLAE
jgi:peroxiredoxin